VGVLQDNSVEALYWGGRRLQACTTPVIALQLIGCDSRWPLFQGGLLEQIGGRMGEVARGLVMFMMI
jgi:hypothetical protein